jgi:cell division protein FtsB
MEEYGYMENGILRSKIIEQDAQKYKDANGKICTKIITIQAQIDALDDKYKPVDPIDDSKVKDVDDGYIIRLEPYDAGDHIAYNYVKVFDTKKVKSQIQDLKDALSDSDYKITKCYEANLLGESLPYDVNTLHTERQAKRDQINTLESTLSEKEGS